MANGKEIHREVSQETLESLLKVHGEGDYLDFKQSFSLSSQKEKAELVRDILAFANTKGGGYIIYGVVDKVYTPLGLPPINILPESNRQIDTTNIYRALGKYLPADLQFMAAEYEIQWSEWPEKRRFGILYISKYRGVAMAKCDVSYSEGKKTVMVVKASDILVRRGAQSCHADQITVKRLMEGERTIFSALQASVPSKRGVSRRTLVVGLAGLAVVGLAGGGIIRLAGVHPPSTSIPLSRGTTLFIYHGHWDVVNAVSWSPNGKLIASGGVDGTVQVWNASDGSSAFTYHQRAGVSAVAWSPDGRRIASASFDNTVQVWDATDGGHVLTYRGHSEIVVAVAWSPDGSRIVSSAENVQVWDANSGEIILINTNRFGGVMAVAWSLHSKRIASGSVDERVRVWDAADGGHDYTYREHTGAVNAVTWSPDGSRIASGSADKTVRVWVAG